MAPNTLKLKLGVDTFTSKSLFDFKSGVQKLWANTTKTCEPPNTAAPRWRLSVCHHPNDSHVGDFVLDSELRLQTKGDWQWVNSIEREQRLSQGELLVAKATLIKTLCVFVNPGIWELKLADWINIFSPPQATVFYLTFWKFIWVNLAAEATDSEVVNNTSPLSPEHSHTAQEKKTFLYFLLIIKLPWPWAFISVFTFSYHIKPFSLHMSMPTDNNESNAEGTKTILTCQGFKIKAPNRMAKVQTLSPKLKATRNYSHLMDLSKVLRITMFQDTQWKRFLLKCHFVGSGCLVRKTEIHKHQTFIR